jgi:hypothetical protein
VLVLHLLLHQQLNSMNRIFFKEFLLPPNNKNGCKNCVRQWLSTNMFRMKDVVTLDAKVVSITLISQGHTYIYELLVHELIVNNLPCTHFVSIDVFPSCTCSYFVFNVTSYRHSYFLSRKHMYYIYNLHLNLIRDN